MAEWVWRTGAAPAVASAAQMVGEVVEHLEDEHGRCTPAMLVDAARPASSPLHRLFQWEDEAAAEGYRRGQARRYIRSLRVVVDNVVSDAPAFVHVKRIDQSPEGYARWMRVVRDPVAREFVLEEALAALAAVRTRYEALAELAEVWEAVDRAGRPEPATGDQLVGSNGG